MKNRMNNVTCFEHFSIVIIKLPSVPWETCWEWSPKRTFFNWNRWTKCLPALLHFVQAPIPFPAGRYRFTELVLGHHDNIVHFPSLLAPPHGWLICCRGGETEDHVPKARCSTAVNSSRPDGMRSAL